MDFFSFCMITVQWGVQQGNRKKISSYGQTFGCGESVHVSGLFASSKISKNTLKEAGLFKEESGESFDNDTKK